MYTKGLCSFGFILTAYLSHQTKLFLLILPGLLAFMIGDLLLCKKNLFKYGLNAFLIGDIACLFFYYHYQPFTYIELIAPVVSMILLEVVTYSKDIDYKTEITSYIFALVWLTTKSILAAITMNTLNFKMMALGFILYLLSDVFLAFYKKNKYQILGILNIFFYYFGIFLTAYSFSFI
ncbi:MAG: lysoplasmalogenase family protein [Catenibacterium mitsuokai]|nr:lysoplasmalogenase family protein [Catenibacterium mitsuokai]MDD6596462.1 lysoplasmalogenase family protein [Catenibacterium mitsuokai]